MDELVAGTGRQTKKCPRGRGEEGKGEEGKREGKRGKRLFWHFLLSKIESLRYEMITKELGKFITFLSALSLSPKNSEILNCSPACTQRKFRFWLPPHAPPQPSLTLPPHAQHTT